MTFLRYRSLLYTLLSAWVVSSREVPMKKAMPPRMDPIPTLPEITHRVYFDITVNGNKEETKRVVFGLFGTIAPKTVDNFRALAACNKGRGAITGKPLCYKGSRFHRVIPHFGLQGGDFTHHDGTGGESIFGGRFEDESFQVAFHLPYMLAMSNTGKKNTNGSQFFITTVKAQWLTGKNVIFGMVLEGREVVDEMEEYGSYGGKPTALIEIVDCGETPLLPEDKEVHYA